MDFGDAIRALKDGKRVGRSGWNGRGMWLRLRGPSDGWQGEHPPRPKRAYIELKDATDQLVPWLASQTDLLATDWEIVEATR